MQHFLRSVSDNAAGIACSASVLALGIYVLFTRIRPSLARPKKNLL